MKSWLVLLFFPAIVLAQADLRIDTRTAATLIEAGQTLFVGAQVTNHGPATARGIVITFDPIAPVFAVSDMLDFGIRCTAGPPTVCRTYDLAAGQSVGVWSIVSLPRTLNAEIVAGAAVSSDTPDPDAANNRAGTTVRVTTDPDLRPRASVDAIRVQPSQRMQFLLSLGWSGIDPPRDVRLIASLPAGGRFLGARVRDGDAIGCDVADDALQCVSRELTHSGALITVDVEAPARLTGGEVRIDANATAAADYRRDNDAFTAATKLMRHLVVSNLDDAGEGSLRRALDDTNRFCDDDYCQVDLAVDGAIRVTSPLPAVAARHLILDGNVEIDGSALTAGSGLIVESGCEAVVRGLTIRGFPDFGLVFAPQACGGPFARAVTENTIVANGRGMLVTSVVQGTEVARNTISDNRLSGVWVEGMRFVLRENRIERNGRSGVLVLDGIGRLLDNRIANSSEFGIALTGRSIVEMRRNSIAANGLFGIDYELDLASPSRHYDDYPNAPHVRSVRYDARADVTLIEASLDSDGVRPQPPEIGSLPDTASWEIDAYRNATGLPEGEAWLTSQVLERGQTDFTMRVPGNLTGSFVTLTNTRIVTIPHGYGAKARVVQTSEFSNAVATSTK